MAARSVWFALVLLLAAGCMLQTHTERQTETEIERELEFEQQTVDRNLSEVLAALARIEALLRCCDP
jgi:hypothetical protein